MYKILISVSTEFTWNTKAMSIWSHVICGCFIATVKVLSNCNYMWSTKPNVNSYLDLSGKTLLTPVL